MIIEIFLLVEILAVCSFALGWFTRNIIMWGVSTILFGIQMITGFNIEYIILRIVNGELVQTIMNHSSPIAYINMLFFALSIIMLFTDIFSNRNVIGKRELD